jgi:Uma2 family endonuclease
MTAQVEEQVINQKETAEGELKFADFSRTYTVDEFMELILPDDEQYELINGELVQMNRGGPAYEHGKVTSNLFLYLGAFVKSNSLGEVLNNLAFALTNTTSPIPDLAFVAATRPTVEDPRKAYPGPPDLAIEVLSRTDIVFNVDEKIEAYLTNGVRLVWIINPRRKTVEVFRPATGFKSQCVIGQEELDGEEVVPGFKLAVEKLFD